MSRQFAIGPLAALIAVAACAGSANAQQVAPAPQQIAPAAHQPVAPPPAPIAAGGTPEQMHDDARIPDENAKLAPRFQTQVVPFSDNLARGSIIIDTPHHFLYYILGDGRAIRYGIGVGRSGFAWSGVKKVARKREWPDWYPPPEMIERQPYLPRMMAGGPGNPLGSRALYIGHTEYRIHGTNDPTSIGKNTSSGCIHLTNDNAIDLYDRVKVGAKVIVLPRIGAPTPDAKNEPRGWRRQVQAAIAAADQSLREMQTPRIEEAKAPRQITGRQAVTTGTLPPPPADNEQASAGAPAVPASTTRNSLPGHWLY
jgi:lipoprotein-anchoring transpeptidase ErfK/SrfK